MATVLALALTALVACGSLLAGVVAWVQYVVAFSGDASRKNWNFTVASRSSIVSSASLAAAADAEKASQEALTYVQMSGHAPQQLTTSAPEQDLLQCAPISVTDTFVINMDDQPDRYNNFMQHLSTICGINIERVYRHSGVVASAAMIDDDWVKELIPGVKGEAAVRIGSLGLALAHLSLWAKISRTEGCSLEGAEDAYALIFEDDERPRSFFADALNQVMRVVQRFPSGTRPDMINLNVKRPSGRAVATLKYPQRFTVMEIAQKAREWRTGPLCGELHCNVWMSAYMVRCGGIQNLIHYGGRYPDGAHIYSGVTPTFDRQMSDVQSDARTPVKGWSVGPENIISVHREGFDSRKKRDAEAMKHMLAQGGKRPILNSKEFVHEEFDEAFEGFEWH